MAKLLPINNKTIEYAAQRLNDGYLVAFPTETVYGLGASALDAKAARKIFVLKRRPATDPLICHVATSDKALDLLNLTSEELSIFDCLKHLWPGPLTIVSNAASSVPSVVKGESTTVGVRIPNHPIALKLLQTVNIPIAAPSANLFGHISPTMASHVMDDLGLDKELTVLDGGLVYNGLESTVVEIRQKSICILRLGALPVSKINEQISKLKTPVNIIPYHRREVKSEESIVLNSPGQLLTHYSPTIPSYLIKIENSCMNKPPNYGNLCSNFEHSLSKLDLSIKDLVVLDFKEHLSFLKDQALSYRLFSNNGSIIEAALQLFDILRWAEAIPNAKAIAFIYVDEFDESIQYDKDILMSISDRLYRAASGNIINISSLHSN